MMSRYTFDAETGELASLFTRSANGAIETYVNMSLPKDRSFTKPVVVAEGTNAQLEMARHFYGGKA